MLAEPTIDLGSSKVKTLSNCELHTAISEASCPDALKQLNAGLWIHVL